MCTDKDETFSSAYDIKGKEKMSSTSENKENVWDAYVHIYEYCEKSALQPSNARV